MFYKIKPNAIVAKYTIKVKMTADIFDQGIKLNMELIALISGHLVDGGFPSSGFAFWSREKDFTFDLRQTSFHRTLKFVIKLLLKKSEDKNLCYCHLNKGI